MAYGRYDVMCHDCKHSWTTHQRLKGDKPDKCHKCQSSNITCVWQEE
jgi:hypothetical protein